jgi:hypothetical protein
MATVPNIPMLGNPDYPTTDGKPMAETDWHRDLMLDLIETLKIWYEDQQRVYVSGNLLLFYVRGNKRRHISPRRKGVRIRKYALSLRIRRVGAALARRPSHRSGPARHNTSFVTWAAVMLWAKKTTPNTNKARDYLDTIRLPLECVSWLRLGLLAQARQQLAHRS